MRKGSYSEELVRNKLEELVTARGHRRCPDADATGRKRRGVATDRVAIQRDGRSLTHLLHLGPRQSVWTKIPEHQVIVSSATGELVPLGNQGLCQGACIGHNGLVVFHKFRCVHLQQVRSQGSDLVVVRPTLQCDHL